VGFRGALCQGGRDGQVSRDRVSRLKSLLEASGSVHQAEPTRWARRRWRNARPPGESLPLKWS